MKYRFRGPAAGFVLSAGLFFEKMTDSSGHLSGKARDGALFSRSFGLMTIVTFNW